MKNLGVQGIGRHARSLLLLGLLAHASITPTHAQDTTGIMEPPGPDQFVSEVPQGFMTSREIQLSVLVLAFGVVVLVFEYMLLRSRRSSPTAVLRIFGVTLIIVGTLFALTAGFAAEHIAPAMGLFGTIAGYLLGRSANPQAQKEEEA